MTFKRKNELGQVYFVSQHELDFRSFHMIGKHLNEQPPLLKEALEALKVNIVGNLETLYTFIDDPNGPDIPHGKFFIEIGFPVSWQADYEGPYSFVVKPNYNYISKEHKYPPFTFPWEELRDFADNNGMTRTLRERDYHIKLQSLGDDCNIMECRVEIE